MIFRPVRLCDHGAWRPSTNRGYYARLSEREKQIPKERRPLPSFLRVAPLADDTLALHVLAMFDVDLFILGHLAVFQGMVFQLLGMLLACFQARGFFLIELSRVHTVRHRRDPTFPAAYRSHSQTERRQTPVKRKRQLAPRQSTMFSFANYRNKFIFEHYITCTSR